MLELELCILVVLSDIHIRSLGSRVLEPLESLEFLPDAQWVVRVGLVDPESDGLSF